MKMESKTWIRRDRETGEEDEIHVDYAIDRLMSCYRDLNTAMALASKKSPLTNGFADYYPAEVNQ